MPFIEQFKKACSNPWIGLIGCLASVFGIILGIFFYYSGIRKPKLTALVHPVRTSIVNGHDAAEILKVTFNDKPVIGNISAAQIALWNDGNESIREESILVPITISTTKNTPILDASIRMQTREVNKTHLDKSELANGILKVNWKILEENDGCILQIIYSGSPNTKISVSGVLERQNKIKEIPPPIGSTTEYSLYDNYKRNDKTSVAFSSFMIVFVLAVGTFIEISTRKSMQGTSPDGIPWPETKRARRLRLLTYGSTSLCIVSAIYFLVLIMGKLLNTQPPFPF